MAWVAVAGTGLVAVRWWSRRVDALGRRRAFPWISFALLVAMTVSASAPGVRRAAEERRLSRVAAVLAGGRVQVHCQSLGRAVLDTGSALGYVRYGADGRLQRSALLKREQCRQLASYLRSAKGHPSYNEVTAVHVLAHESMHMRGTAGESAAECAAVQRDAQLARLLGASAGAARELAVAYWRGHYPYLPEEYRSKNCARGAALDEHLPDAPW